MSFGSLVAQRDRYDTSWGAKKIIFLIRDIVGPAIGSNGGTRRRLGAVVWIGALASTVVDHRVAGYCDQDVKRHGRLTSPCDGEVVQSLPSKDKALRKTLSTPPRLVRDVTIAPNKSANTSLLLLTVARVASD